MPSHLTLSIGQCTDPGRKAVNQDFHGALIPREPLLGHKGAALALADGISSSDVSQIASAMAVKSFLDDYFCTSEALSVRKAVEHVLSAINSWLFSETRRSAFRYDKDRGYVCTFSALVVKAHTAHLFHIGDSRIYRLHASGLEQLTKDHRLQLSQHERYLSRALGSDEYVEIDYQALPLTPGDTFLLATDGVYEHADTGFVLATLREHADDLDAAAQRIVEHALARGSEDNLTLQILRIDSLPGQHSSELQRQIEQLPLPPPLAPRMVLDGYRIEREIHATSRSHVFIAHDEHSGDKVVLKTPSIDQSDDAAYLERFMLEEWIARRIDSAHVIKAAAPSRPRGYLYTVTEYIDGQTLAQWMTDHPRPDLETVRQIIEQIARGLRAFHRRDMIHQDLKPDNIMIDRAGTVKIIDFGSTRVAGIAEANRLLEQPHLLGTALYSAPEYFLGEAGSERSDLYSLAVIAYQMLSGRFPYGNQVARSRTVAAQRRLDYASVLDDEREIPAWIDTALEQALHPDPLKRQDDLSEFIHDLRHPNRAYLNRTRPPLLERNPVLFWQSVSGLLAGALIYLLAAGPLP